MAKSTYKFCAYFTKAWNAPNFVKVVCATPIKTIVPKIVKNINKKKQSNNFLSVFGRQFMNIPPRKEKTRDLRSISKA
jgi:hypothetical protein